MKKILILIVVVMFHQQLFAQGAGFPFGKDTLIMLQNTLRQNSLKVLKNKLVVGSLRQVPLGWQQQLVRDMGEKIGVVSFDRNRPVVYVLIHGVTGFNKTDTRIGTLEGARNYWGYEFVDGLFANSNGTASYTTFVDAANPFIGRTNWETKFLNSNNPLQHFISTSVPNVAENSFPQVSVMLTYRLGNLPMLNQVRDAAGQITLLYKAAFDNWPENKKPQIVLLCHSFGGVVARAICSEPNYIPTATPVTSMADDAFAKADKTLRGINNRPIMPPMTMDAYFEPADFWNFEFIRNKTLHITTLSTPHEGSPLTKVTSLAEDLLPLTPFMGSIGRAIDETDPDRQILNQLIPEYLQTLNKGILRPDKCKRRNGTLIPIHVLGGRCAGGPNFYSNPNASNNGLGNVFIDSLLPDESNRMEIEAKGLVQVDIALHNLPDIPMPWGAVPSNNTRLDAVCIKELRSDKCMVSQFSMVNFLSPKLIYLRQNWRGVGTTGNFPCGMSYAPVANTVLTDGEIDHDGFVGIGSSLGSNLGTSLVDFFDHSTSWNSNGVNAPVGSWYRFYSSGANFHNHGTIKFNKQVSNWVRDNILQNMAGPKVATSGTISSW